MKGVIYMKKFDFKDTKGKYLDTGKNIAESGEYIINNNNVKLYN